MTEINHHLTESLVMGYAAGTLPEAVNLIVAAHVSMCDTCRAAVEAHEALGGALLDDTDAVAMDDGALQRALDAVRGADPEPRPIRVAEPDPIVPAPLADYIGGGLDDVRWRPLGMGVKQAILPTAPGATARLLFIPAGTAVPDHGHNGLELTLVLQGAFSDEGGRYARGDVEVADGDTEHMPVADISADCICLAVTDAPLKFHGVLPRLLQPLFRI
ncbi:ChrR family anti-sigma-E factor [Sagittula stellata]|uniref:Anti-sigma factor ChrR n=1 Tax=Sagittula stellata (strain ATCC 700073 / DSM 11524 / E-37) TaxID=388399 RepID=A3KB41_SAGS3|nr:ChrR family anti-sigma-E factor [Sagittula stellata]EBA05626.1 Anti-sigma factor ChrR [Sagittula stellata E-37]